MDYCMADIFDEVSEELKHDQLVKIWKKYSKFIIVGIIFTIYMHNFLPILYVLGIIRK